MLEAYGKNEEEEIDIETIPILNIEDAKNYFKKMECSHYNIGRKNFQRAEEYYKFDVNLETEDMWAKEWREENKPKELLGDFNSLGIDRESRYDFFNGI